MLVIAGTIRLDPAKRDEAFAAARSGDPEWLARLRADAMARFAELGFRGRAVQHTSHDD